MKKKYLILENGDIFEGVAFGADRDSIGELVFTTGTCGYIETLTDPSYFGQIVMQTFPQIGNYGIIPQDFEGKPALFGYVVREYCDTPSNFRSAGDIDSFLKENGIPGIYGVDTRAITRIIRESGVMNAIITSDPDTDISALSSYSVKNALGAVSTGVYKTFSPEKKLYNVALIDYGAKKNIVRELTKRGCEVIEYPYDVSAESVLEYKPDGIMLSNGPGDPAENTYQIEQIKKLAGRLPIFGICLGHQLLALALGCETEKMHYGHRGGNQPAKQFESGRTFITSQNHGYAVKSESVKKGVISFVNANDGSCEGIDYPEYKAFSVQFHPEACSGPHDTGFLFDKFIDLMKKN